jgi:hypothetical protein
MAVTPVGLSFLTLRVGVMAEETENNLELTLLPLREIVVSEHLDIKVKVLRTTNC